MKMKLKIIFGPSKLLPRRVRCQARGGAGAGTVVPPTPRPTLR